MKIKDDIDKNPVFSYILDINPKKVKKPWGRESYQKVSAKEIVRDEVGRHFSFDGIIENIYQKIDPEDELEFMIKSDRFLFHAEIDNENKFLDSIKKFQICTFYVWLAGWVQISGEKEMMRWVHIDEVENCI